MKLPNQGKDQDKGKGIVEEDDDHNMKISKSERIEKEKSDKELDEIDALRRQFKAEEAKAKVAKLILETQKSLFLAWSLERIQKESIKDPNLYWLEPTTSFDLSNNVECQFDFPINPRAFLFRCFESIEKSMISTVQ